MNREDDPQLWDLLDQAHKYEPSPFFSRNVIRAIRQSPAPKRFPFSWFGRRRLVPAFSLVLAALLTFGLVETFQRHSAPSRDDRMLVADGSDPDLASDLDVLVANDNDDDDDSAQL